MKPTSRRSAVLALLLTSSFSGTSIAGELQGVLKNNSGVKKFTANKGTGAFDEFTGALADLPYSGVVHYNIGNSFMHNKEFEKAISEYQEAVRVSKGDAHVAKDARFYAHFNQGVAYTELKKNDEALEAYQAALADRPDSIETKTNIELLSSGGGQGGEGENQDQKEKNDKKDSQGKDDKKNQLPQKFDNPKPSPKPFKSEELTPQDVKRIMEELKRQEEQIRARMENDQRKEAPIGKDW